MTDINSNNPWLAAAIELNSVVKLESPSVQQAQWELSKKKYPQVQFPNDDDFHQDLDDISGFSADAPTPEEELFPSFTVAIRPVPLGSKRMMLLMTKLNGRKRKLHE